MQKGFTLIEVLTVVCVIGILVVIATPSYVKAREEARRVLCSENIRLIDQAKAQMLLWNPYYSSEMSPLFSDLYGEDTWLPKVLYCPSGGDYSMNSFEQEATCTVHPRQ